VGLYTLIACAAFSAIRYKTPWNLLPFYVGAVLMAGYGTAALLGGIPSRVARALVAAGLLLAVSHLAVQDWRANFRYPADPRNPYVYAHTGTDVFAIVQRLERLAQAHPEGAAMPLQVISRENLWPLPWYLRRFTRVEWWNGVSAQAKTAPVVLITPEMEEALVRKLYDLPPPGERELYVGMFARPVELRPGVEVRLYAANSLREELRRREAGPPPAGLARP
jgi:hypothetical protein